MRRILSRSISTVLPGTSFVYQHALPRLVIPKLTDTCDRLQSLAQPILSKDEFCSLQSAIEELKGPIGQDAHSHLLSYDRSRPWGSFIEEFWDQSYTKDRKPLVMWNNPFLQFHPDPRPEIMNQTRRAATLVHSIAHFETAIRNQSLEPDVFHTGSITQKQWFKSLVSRIPLQKGIGSNVAYLLAVAGKGYPMDMSQYEKLFGTTRIPRADRDEVRTLKSGRHILVGCGTDMYSVDILDEEHKPVPAAVLEQSFRAIIVQSKHAGHPLGLLTSDERDKWAATRDLIKQVPSNAKALGAIDSSLFALLLDSNAPTDPISFSRVFLHGDEHNPRWHDKCFQLVVCANGEAALNFEHSWGDGLCVLRLCNEIFSNAMKHSAPWTAEAVPLDRCEGVERLVWNLDDRVVAAIDSAAARLNEHIDSLSLSEIAFEGYGKQKLKSTGLSPDAVFQMALQMAHFRMQDDGCLVSSYQSQSTAAFRHGRTETIRPATQEALAFVQSMNAGAPRSECFALLQSAVSQHKRLSTQAAMGQGVDRHLLALESICERDGLIAPRLFTEPGFKKFRHIILSTVRCVHPVHSLQSTLSGAGDNSLAYGGFGPVSEDGFGIAYGSLPDRVGGMVSSYDSKKGSTLAAGVCQALEDIGRLID